MDSDIVGTLTTSGNYRPFVGIYEDSCSYLWLKTFPNLEKEKIEEVILNEDGSLISFITQTRTQGADVL